MSSKKITMDYDEYLKDIEKIEENLSEKFLIAGQNSIIEEIFYMIKDEDSLRLEIDYMKEVLEKNEELDEELSEARKSWIIKKLKILSVIMDGLRK